MFWMTFLLSAPDAGCEGILSPGQYVQLGTLYPVRARFKNYGDVQVSFPVYFRIDTAGGQNVYQSSSSVNNLPPGGTIDITFSPDWTPPVFGTYIAYAWSDLAGDSYHGDDTALIYIKCYHDAQAIDVFWPYAENSVGIPVQPAVKVKNGGSYTEGIPLKLNIYAPGGGLVYSGSTTTTALMPDSILLVQLPNQWTPTDTGTFTAELITTLGQDLYPVNDTTRENFKVSYEIIYDQGIPDQFRIVSVDYYNNKMAVRFTPTISPPLYITEARIFMTNDTLDYVMVCPDMGGLPDTGNPFFTYYNLCGNAFLGEWVGFSINPPIYLSALRDVWLLVHWPPSCPYAPSIGSDWDVPVDGRSWFFRSDQGWQNFPYEDWMFRITQSPTVQIAENIMSPGLLISGPAPNPCRDEALLSFCLPAESRVEVKLYAADGRIAEELFSGVKGPGPQDLSLRLTSPPGVYFLRFTAGEQNAIRKLVIIK